MAATAFSLQSQKHTRDSEWFRRVVVEDSVRNTCGEKGNGDRQHVASDSAPYISVAMQSAAVLEGSKSTALLIAGKRSLYRNTRPTRRQCRAKKLSTIAPTSSRSVYMLRYADIFRLRSTRSLSRSRRNAGQVPNALQGIRHGLNGPFQSKYHQVEAMNTIRHMAGRDLCTSARRSSCVRVTGFAPVFAAHSYGNTARRWKRSMTLMAFFCSSTFRSLLGNRAPIALEMPLPAWLWEP